MNDLKIIDVTEFDFFNNPENDKAGMEAAKTADLILFLLTNDAPAMEDAQCLAQLKSLGKKILGVVNIKKNLNFKKNNATIKNLNQILSNTAEFEEFVAQFKKLAENYHQSWSDIKFFPTHLAAAYHAMQTDNVELYLTSRFSDIEDFIIEEFFSDGQILHIKNFVDSIAIPMNDILMKIFEHSGNSLKESKIWLDEARKIMKWRRDFWDRSQNRLYKLFSELSENLNNAIPNFVEDHYDDENINENWSHYLQDFGYVERYRELLESFSCEYREKLEGFSDELIHELKYTLDGKTQTNVEVEGTSPWGKYAAIVLPKLLLLMPGMGWATRVADNAGSNFLQSLFKSKATKIRGAKVELYRQLTDSSFNMLNKLNNQARDIFNRQMLGNVDEFTNTLVNYAYMLTRLGETQSELAEKFIEQYAELNSVLFLEAISYKSAGEIQGVKATIRLPGEISVIIAEKFSVDTKAISELLGERFFVIEPLNSWEETVRKILGSDFEINSYPLEFETDAKTYSLTPKGKLSERRAILAQQISPYPILKG